MSSTQKRQQHLPEGYSIRTPNAPDPEGALWDAVEDLAIDGEIGADPFDSQLDLVVDSPDGVMIGATWSTERDGHYGFHFAVSREHQGKGIGSFFMDAAIEFFNQRKAQSPDLNLDVCVVNDTVVSSLMRRGLKVESEEDEIEQNRTYYMKSAPSFQDMLKDAMHQNTQETMLAMRMASDKTARDLESFTPWLMEWFESPSPLNEHDGDAVEEFLICAPLSKYDKQYLTARTAEFRPNKEFTLTLKPADQDTSATQAPSQQEIYSPTQTTRRLMK